MLRYFIHNKQSQRLYNLSKAVFAQDTSNVASSSPTCLATNVFDIVQSGALRIRDIHTTDCTMKIYTKTGDDGSSCLYNGERRGKDDLVFAALGDVDELNSVVGLAREFALPLDGQLGNQLEQIQSRLLDVGSAIATPIPTSSDAKLNRTAFDSSVTAQLEDWIDCWTEELPTLTLFILPSGGPAASFLHMARSVCRRAERSVVPLTTSGSMDTSVGVYLNRLSDYLFTAARIAAKRAGKPEVTYRKA